jgi:nucleoside phosphorylase
LYVGPGSLSDLLEWFRTDAFECLLLLFVGGGPKDVELIGSIFDARDSLDALTSDDLAMFLQAPDFEKRELASFVRPGAQYVLPLMPLIKSSALRSHGQQIYRPIHLRDLQRNDRDAVIRSTIQFTRDVVEHFALAPSDLPAILVVPRTTRNSLGKHLTFPIGDDFDVKGLFALVRELRQLSYEPLSDELEIHRYSKESTKQQEKAEEKYENQIETALTKLTDTLRAFASNSDYKQLLRDITKHGWEGDSSDAFQELETWARNVSDGDDFIKVQTNSDIREQCRRLDRLFERARKNYHHLQKGLMKQEPEWRRPFAWSRPTRLVVSNYDAIAEVLRKHQPLIRSATDNTQDAVTLLVEALSRRNISPGATTTAGRSIDVVAVIALREEFDEFAKLIELHSKWDKDLVSYVHSFEVVSHDNRVTKGAAVCLDGMGQERAAAVAAQLISNVHPGVLISIGIAGGLSPDSAVGDVIVGMQIDGFHVASKIVDTGKCLLSGEVYRSTPRFVEHALNLSIAYPHQWEEMSQRSREEFRRLLKPNVRSTLIRERVVRDKLQVSTGHIASGPFVAATREVRDWLLSRDRKYVAIEMEAYGVMLAASRGETAGFVIRGLSDLADDRKTYMDAVADGMLRRYAMRNATRFLFTMMKLGLLSWVNF